MPGQLGVIVPATRLSTVRVTQTLSLAQPCVLIDEITGALSAWAGPAVDAIDNRNVAATASTPSSAPPREKTSLWIIGRPPILVPGQPETGLPQSWALSRAA